MNKDKKLIPKGVYCYDEKGVCPYWSLRKDKPYQFNGYCSYLEKGDWELNKKYVMRGVWTNNKGEVVEGPKEFPLSLLWDQCKECGINDEVDE